MENNFENKMENLNTPNADFVKHQEVLKIGMMNARKSARIGIIFILIPILIVVLVYLKMKLLVHWDFFSKFQQFVSNQNQSSFLSWLSHIILLGFPILAIFINLLAITHFYIDKKKKGTDNHFKVSYKKLDSSNHKCCFVSSRIYIRFVFELGLVFICRRTKQLQGRQILLTNEH